jgi:hypothetical protein
MSREMMVTLWADTTLVGALSQVQSGWFDIGKQTPMTEVTRTNTGGTYAFEVDWSRDGGSSTMTMDTITTVAGEATPITGKARWCRFRVRNTHATVAFSAHSTTVKKDAGTTT